ncbi:MAG: 7-cyano-7-deazaguanine synthase QueC [Candidatus Omnitrophica bacterium]|nr:7-cyano-7-deazaguanine synthase QueC [Candidatus Omnitrophota bacterium]
MKKAVVLLSGGLDSATTLYEALRQGYRCHCLIFDYGQRHRRELKSAQAVARAAKCSFQVITIALPWKGSALLHKQAALPKLTRANKGRREEVIPSTYVPARNIIFLSFALSCAEALQAQAIFIGAHSHDYSGYPDCRPAFFRAFQNVITYGTKAGVERKGIKIITPLIHKDKADIIRLAQRLRAPLELTWSCYQGKDAPCGACDSCYFRKKGFQEAGIPDPSL